MVYHTGVRDKLRRWSWGTGAAMGGELIMQQPAKTGASAARMGLIYGVIVGVVVIILSLVAQLVSSLSGVFSILSYIVVLAGAAYVGYVAAARTGKTGSGAIAGLLLGVITGVFSAVYTIVYFLLNQNTFLAQAQQAAVKQGASASTITPGILLFGIIFAAVFVILIYLVIGVVVGVIAGLVGKGRAPQPTTTYSESMYSGLPPTPPQAPAQ